MAKAPAKKKAAAKAALPRLPRLSNAVTAQSHLARM